MYLFDAVECWAPAARRRSPPQSKLPTRPYNKTIPIAARGGRSPPSAAPPTKTYKKYETRGWPQIAPQAKFFFEVLIPLTNFNFFYKIRYFLSKKSSNFLSVQFFFIKNNLFLDLKKSSFLFSKKWHFESVLSFWFEKQNLKVFRIIDFLIQNGAVLVMFGRKSELSICWRKKPISQIKS